ncbi:MAG: protein kinase [Desulfovibrio sp.]|nr:protein kinase [Desulfovibrio sp.]MBI4958471.1 protein kinase [Desulfovibrio sp.]
MTEAIQHYDIIDKIGEGGMGMVYKAVHRTLERPVAIKRLAAHLAKNQNMLERFLKEAKLQAKLSHANVVNIFDFLEWEGEVYLVMEYVCGQSVKDMLQANGRLSIQEALHIAAGVLSGLAFMHKNGIVHRDIKPSNIIVSESGQVKVTDFGIARLVEDDSGLTRFGAGVGTLQYMAPELLKSGEVSFSVDIYSMGVTLYEMLSGTAPFTGVTDLEIMLGHIEKTPPPLDLPEDEAGLACREMVLKALAKTPGERFASAEAFLAEIKRISRFFAPDQADAYPMDSGRTQVPTENTVKVSTPGAESPVNLDTGKAATMMGEAPLPQIPSGAPPVRRKAMLAAMAAVLVLGVGGYFLLARQEAPKGLPAQSAPAPAPLLAPAPTPAPVPQAGTPVSPPDAPATAPGTSAAPTELASGPVSAAQPQEPVKTETAPSAPVSPESAAKPEPAPPSSKAQEQPPVASQPAGEPSILYTQAKGVRLRETPDNSGNILATLDVNTKLDVIEIQKDWVKVTAPQGLTGYVSTGQLASQQAQPPASAAPRTPGKTPKKSVPGGDTGWRIIK